MRFVTPGKLSELQKVVDNVRNICILAHVDHGKTTLADSLVASNGIISAKAVGSLRYMDSRPDEQMRGITMKSSSISLLHQFEGAEYLVNLIDSPGHVDFSSEVSTAVRLCDGAIILVDVVEGVCPQTRVALKQAYSENIKPVLVLNKIDRLILEMQLSPLDAYVHMVQILEQVNAVIGDIFASDVFEKEETDLELAESDSTEPYNWTSALEDVDDSHLYFCPEAGNVVFASAVDGWGFKVDKFAKIFADKLGVKEELLKKVIWGDFYLDSKTKRVLKGAQEKAKKPLFVQLILENIWSLYDTIMVRKERDKVETITKKLGINLTIRDLKHRDPKVQLQSVASQWLPLAEGVLNMVCNKLPSPKQMCEEKVEKLMCSQNQRFDSMLPETQKLKEHFLACDSSDERPVIVYISKMFPVDKKVLPCNRARPLTAEEIARRREIARQRQIEKQSQSENEESSSVKSSISEETKMEERANVAESDTEGDVFIGFARIFSGTLKKGSKLYVLGPKHDPKTYSGNLDKPDVDVNLTLKDLKSNQHITQTEVFQLYLLMGRELEELDEVPAGNILGIGGLDEHVLKTATLSTTLYCPSFTEMRMFAVPIVRVAVETQHPADMPKLIKGLKLLNQADACVQVLIQETGEHVLLTAGEVHLERCLEDLSSRYAKVPVTVSDPIVPFRETIIEPPKIDMVNEDIDSQALTLDETSEKIEEKTIVMQTPNKQCTIRLRAIPLPKEVTAILEKNSDILKIIDSQSKHSPKSTSNSNPKDDLEIVMENLNIKSEEKITNVESLTSRSLKAIEQLKQDLKKAFQDAGSDWQNTANEIWAAGPRKCGPNLLLNRIKDFRKSLFDPDEKSGSDIRNDFTGSFLNGFQLATLAGPLCEEPMMGVAFVVEEWIISQENDDSAVSSQPYGPFSGQIMSCVKEGCRKAFQAQPQRLMAAMYSCQISAKAQVLGAMYSVLRRRHGRLLTEETDRLSSSFSVTAYLPVLESFRLTDELRKQTSGLATMQMVFSHFETIEIDPFWTPSTESEYVHFGEKADSANRAKKYMDAVRRRKGLQVDDKLVEFAEKQRTLSKNK